MNSVLIATDVLAMAFMIVILLSIRFLEQKADAIMRKFILCISVTLLCTVADALSYYLEVRCHNVPVLWTVNMIAYIGADVSLLSFIFYAWAVIGQKTKFSHGLANAAAFLVVLNIAFIITGGINGKGFSISDYRCMEGPWANYDGIIPIVVMIYFFSLVISRRKETDRKTMLMIGSYFVFPALTVFMEILSPNYSFVYASVSLSLMIIFITIQSGELQRSRLREEMMKDLLYTDGLTGLNNRRAFEETIDSAEKDADIDVIFCDVNGLKYANDNFGHAAGDELLMKFTEILTSFFDKKDLFRISGDEFLVIQVNEHVSDDKLDKFREVILENSWIAAFGNVSGKGEAIIELISEAEKKMYKDKSNYYIKTGRNRRQ